MLHKRVPSETEILAARLARIKNLIEDLERECSDSAAQHALFLKLKQEMDAARAGLKVIRSHDPA